MICQSAILLFVANYRQPLATHTTPVRAAENTMFFFRQRIFLDVEIGTCLDATRTGVLVLQKYSLQTLSESNFRIDKELGGRKKQ